MRILYLEFRRLLLYTVVGLGSPSLLPSCYIITNNSSIAQHKHHTDPNPPSGQPLKPTLNQHRRASRHRRSGGATRRLSVPGATVLLPGVWQCLQAALRSQVIYCHLRPYHRQTHPAGKFRGVLEVITVYCLISCGVMY